MITIQELLTPITPAQARATAVSQLVAMGIRADLWRVGGALSVMLTIITGLYANFTVLFAQAIASGFLVAATGGWLTNVAFYVYGVTRPGATFASGSLTLTNTAGASYTFAPFTATFLDSRNKKNYQNVSAISLGPLSAQTITIQAVEAGASSSAPPGEIDTIVTSMLGVECGNAFAVAGSDALDDKSLIALCLAKLGATSVRGPRNAYAFAISVAINPVTLAPVNINRQSITRSSHTGTVAILVASPSGPVSTDDIAGVVSSIEVGVPGLSPPFSGVRPDCVTVTVTSATASVYSPTITVWAEAAPGLAASDLQSQVALALTNYVGKFPIGGVTTDVGTGLWATGVDTALGSVSDRIFSVEGATDLALLANEAAVDAAVVTVRLVSVT